MAERRRRMRGRGEKPKDFKGTVRKLLAYMGHYKAAVVAVMIFAVGSTVLGVIGPRILGNATTELFNGLIAKISGTGGIDFGKIGKSLLFLMGIYAVSGLLSFIQGWIMTGISQKMSFQMREDINKKIDRMPLAYFEKNTVGDVLSRITNDVDTLGQSLNQSITQLITSVFTLIGVLVMSLSHPRRDWPISLSMLGIIGLSLLLGNVFSSYSFDRHAEIVGGGWNMQRFYVIGDSQSFYHDVLNYYFMYPVWHKVLMLPLTVSVQFMIPLPWNYYANPTFINVLSRLTYGWYIVGGVSLFYFLYVSWRRDGNMGWWPWWAAVNYAVVAYIVAGSVARYACSFEPLFVPVAVYVLCRLWEGRWRRAFLCWSIAYVVLIVATLLFCLEIQQDTFSKMLQTRSLKHVLQGIPY